MTLVMFSRTRQSSYAISWTWSTCISTVGKVVERGTGGGNARGGVTARGERGVGNLTW